MTVAELTLLGGFEVRLASGTPVDLTGQKERALLAFLSLTAGVEHSRDKLASLLWSDRSDAQARDSLKHAVTRLRQCLPPAEPPAILADRNMVRLDPSAVGTDVGAFERLASEGTTDALERAVALYRGDLLEGISIRDPAFEDWLLIERQRLRQRFEEALSLLMSRSISAGARDRAAESARRLLSLDPLRESAARALMQLHAERGEAAQALKLYEGLRDRLQRELGVKPEVETTQLYETIRQRRSAPQLGQQSSPDEAPPPSTLGKPSIAVLPFENLSGDPEQQYFSDGVTEDIIIELSRFRTLFVIARNSSFAFKGRSLKVQEIARELGVAYIVEGSVRRAGERLRINAQLVDAATGNHLWAERYDRDMRDVFALQDEVARSVASTVSGRVDAAGRERVERLSPVALKAYDLVLRAKALTLKYTRDNNAQALASAERAAALDPTSARAHAHAAWCHFYNYMASWVLDREGALAKAFDLARHAIELDESDGFGHIMLGIIQIFRREYEEARAEIVKAIELNANDPVARRYNAMYLAATGSAEAAVEQIELGRRLNPFDTRWVPWDKGIVCFTARRYEEAIAALKQARDPINEVRGWLAASYAQAGRLAEARATLEEFLRIAETDMAVFPGRRLQDWKSYWHGAFEYRDQADFAHLYEALRKAGLED
ncbi:BTAD domain-containing putative transcriptional regulator [Hypericibacter sp.]|uniref:BTAD domain-containing putative transcriptional regulator n=1 Tax=Hypericibacter sp. TaxID=2705401 RepID=UPI003D6CB31F